MLNRRIPNEAVLSHIRTPIIITRRLDIPTRIRNIRLPSDPIIALDAIRPPPEIQGRNTAHVFKAQFLLAVALRLRSGGLVRAAAVAVAPAFGVVVVGGAAEVVVCWVVAVAAHEVEVCGYAGDEECGGEEEGCGEGGEHGEWVFEEMLVS